MYRITLSIKMVFHELLILVMVVFLLVQNNVNAAETEVVVCVKESPINASRDCVGFNQLNDFLSKTPRIIKDGHLRSSVKLIIEEGEHRLTGPLRVNPDIFVSGSHKFSIEGAGPEKTKLVGTVSFVPTSFEWLSWMPSHWSENNKIKRISLDRAGFNKDDFLVDSVFGTQKKASIEIFFKGERLPIARWPSSGFTKISSTEPRNSNQVYLDLVVDGRYATENAMMLVGYLYHDWAYERLQTGYDSTQKSFFFKSRKPKYGVKSGQRIAVENALIDINSPGQWAYSARDNSIYLMVPSNYSDQESIDIQSVESAFVLDQSSNIHIKNLAISGFKDNAIKIDRSRNVSLDSVDVENIAGTAIRMNGYRLLASNVRIKGIGGAGVVLSGGDRKSLVAGELVLDKCLIENTGIKEKTYAPAVSLSGVGNRVSDCVLKNGPHSAIIFHGNDHVIEGNLIEDFVQFSDDSGAIYTGRDWTARGNKIFYNIIRGVKGYKNHFGVNAIYLDDQASGTQVKYNVLIDVRRGVLVGGGRDNEIRDNVFSNCVEGVLIDDRGRVSKDKNGSGSHLIFIRKFDDVQANSNLYKEKYPEMLSSGFESLSFSGNNKAYGNIFNNCRRKYVFHKTDSSIMEINGVFELKEMSALHIEHSVRDEVNRVLENALDSAIRVNF